MPSECTFSLTPTDGFLVACRSTPSSEYEQTWRLWIYPFLESSNFYEQFKKDEPWDSPSNTQLVAATQLDTLFQCPLYNSPEPESHYLAVADDQTAFPPDRDISFADCTDGTSSTILFLEAPHKHVPWAEPKDLTFSEAVELLTTRPTAAYGHEINTGFFYKPSRGIHVAFLDGLVQLIELPIAQGTAEALLTIAGGETVDRATLQARRELELNCARIYALSVFAVLSLLPVARLQKRPQATKPAN